MIATFYKCAAAKKKKTCDKKAVRKQWLEDLVVNETMKLVEDDASMNAIIAKVMELQNQESTDLPIHEKQLKETEVGGAVAQVVSRAQTDGQHSCNLFHRVHQLRGCRAVSRRLDGIGLSDHLHCGGVRVLLQEVIRIIFEFHIFGHVRPIHIHRQTSNSL